jgi:hypothetical protein
MLAGAGRHEANNQLLPSLPRRRLQRPLHVPYLSPPQVFTAPSSRESRPISRSRWRRKRPYLRPYLWRRRRSRPPPLPEPRRRRRLTGTSAPSSPRRLRYGPFLHTIGLIDSWGLRIFFSWLVNWCDLLMSPLLCCDLWRELNGFSIYLTLMWGNFDNRGAIGFCCIIYLDNMTLTLWLCFAFKGSANDAKQSDLYTMLNKQSSRGQNGSSIAGSFWYSCRFDIAIRFRFCS